MEMEPVYLLKDEPDIAKGRYAVFGKAGALVAQDNDPGAAIDRAWAAGVNCPAIVDLEILQDRLYVF